MAGVRVGSAKDMASNSFQRNGGGLQRTGTTQIGLACIAEDWLCTRHDLLCSIICSFGACHRTCCLLLINYFKDALTPNWDNVCMSYVEKKCLFDILLRNYY